jgi:hypothetical protein
MYDDFIFVTKMGFGLGTSRYLRLWLGRRPSTRKGQANMGFLGTLKDFEIT